MNYKPIKIQPLNKLFFAINHYVSTGDHIGEGIADEVDNETLIIILAVNQELDTDKEDFRKFLSRFNEIKQMYGTEIENRGFKYRKIKRYLKC